MTRIDSRNANFDINPATIIMGLGYAASLLVCIGSAALFVI